MTATSNRMSIAVAAAVVLLSTLSLIVRMAADAPGVHAAAGYRPVPGLEIAPGQVLIFHVTSRADVPRPKFRLRNESDDRIAFTSVKTGCSCTAVDDLPDFLAAGAETELRLSVNQLDGFDTEFMSSVEVCTNRGDFRLYIKAQLPQPTEVRFRPLAMVFSEKRPTSTVTAVFPSSELCRDLQKSILVETIGCEAKNISIVSDTDARDTRRCKIVIEWESPFPSGDASVQVQVGEQRDVFPVVAESELSSGVQK